MTDRQMESRTQTRHLVAFSPDLIQNQILIPVQIQVTLTIRDRVTTVTDIGSISKLIPDTDIRSGHQSRCVLQLHHRNKPPTQSRR